MSFVKQRLWKERLDAERDQKRKEEAEKNHPLAALKEDRTPVNVLSPEVRAEMGIPTEGTKPTLPQGAGTGGGKKEESFTLPSDLREEAAATRGELGEQANDLLEMGKGEREQANSNSEALYEALLAFSKKQDGRYDELLRLVTENNYRENAGAQNLLYDYLRGAETAASDTAARSAAENGGNGDSYSAAMAARTKNEYAAAGDNAAREYYGEYLDRILRVIEASGGDMNDLYSRLQDNVDGAQDVAGKDLSLGADLLKALSDAQEAERKIEGAAFSDLLDTGNSTQTMEISPMRLDEEYKALTADGGGYTATEALMLLWDKYPTMRGQILQKYNELNYAFE